MSLPAWPGRVGAKGLGHLSSRQRQSRACGSLDASLRMALHCMAMPKEKAAAPARSAARDAIVALQPDPKFRQLKELAKVDDPDELLGEMLARLDEIYSMAMSRARTVGKDQTVIMDPDGHTACKVVEIASNILGVKPKVAKGGLFDPAHFGQPRNEVGGQLPQQKEAS
jgi:hypothetical protein